MIATKAIWQRSNAPVDTIHRLVSSTSVVSIGPKIAPSPQLPRPLTNRLSWWCLTALFAILSIVLRSGIAHDSPLLFIRFTMFTYYSYDTRPDRRPVRQLDGCMPNDFQRPNMANRPCSTEAHCPPVLFRYSSMQFDVVRCSSIRVGNFMHAMVVPSICN